MDDVDRRLLLALRAAGRATYAELGRAVGVSEIEDCWFVAGDEAFIVKVRTTDVDALEHVLAALRRLPGVARTRTTVVLSTRWEGRLGGVDLQSADSPPPDVGSNRSRSAEQAGSQQGGSQQGGSQQAGTQQGGRQQGGEERDGRRTQA